MVLNETPGKNKYLRQKKFSLLKRIQNEAQMEIEGITLPAFKKLSEFIVKDYMKHLRKAPGLDSLKGGPDLYAAVLRWTTTVKKFSPKRVQDLGFKVKYCWRLLTRSYQYC